MGVQKTSSRLGKLGNTLGKPGNKPGKKISQLVSSKKHSEGVVSDDFKKGNGAERSQHKKAAGPAYKSVGVKAGLKAKSKPSSRGVNSKLGGRSKVEFSATQSNTKKSNFKSSHFSSTLHSNSRTDALGETVCREVACEGLATSGGYCRLHYIKNWKKIKRKEVILREKKLNQYIEELVVKYPDKYIEAIRQDLASEKDFAKVIYDLDLDEGVEDFDGEGAESADALIDTIKRDFDDDGDAGF